MYDADGGPSPGAGEGPLWSASAGEAGLVAELAGLGAPCGMRGDNTASASPRHMPKAMKRCRLHPVKSCSRARTWAAGRWALTCRRGHLLAAWVREAETNGPGPIQGFAGFLRQDGDAVLAGMKLACSSGVVEGHVNRLRRSSGRCTAGDPSDSSAPRPAAIVTVTKFRPEPRSAVSPPLPAPPTPDARTRLPSRDDPPLRHLGAHHRRHRPRHRGLSTGPAPKPPLPRRAVRQSHSQQRDNAPARGSTGAVRR
jgi:hypothetical protein